MIVMKRGWRSLFLLALPAAAGLRGIVLSVVRGRPKWVPYYLAFTLFNYLAMLEEIADHLRGFPTSTDAVPQERA
jgi:hypothetical protein